MVRARGKVAGALLALGVVIGGGSAVAQESMPATPPPSENQGSPLVVHDPAPTKLEPAKAAFKAVFRAKPSPRPCDDTFSQTPCLRRGGADGIVSTGFQVSGPPGQVQKVTPKTRKLRLWLSGGTCAGRDAVADQRELLQSIVQVQARYTTSRVRLLLLSRRTAPVPSDGSPCADLGMLIPVDVVLPYPLRGRALDDDGPVPARQVRPPARAAG